LSADMIYIDSDINSYCAHRVSSRNISILINNPNESQMYSNCTRTKKIFRSGFVKLFVRSNFYSERFSRIGRTR